MAVNTPNPYHWEHLIGFQEAYKMTQTALKRERFPQVLLLTGREGIGKRGFAHGLSASHFCEKIVKGSNSSPCGACKPCQWIKQGSFSDLLVIDPPEESIKAEEVEKIQNHFNLKPQSSHYYPKAYRIVMIFDVERLTRYAVNALLKTIEEPPANTRIIMTTSKSRLLLPTLKSRAVTFYLSPPPLAQSLAYLKQVGERLARPLSEQVLKQTLMREGLAPGPAIQMLADPEADAGLDLPFGKEPLARVIEKFEQNASLKACSPARFMREVEYHLNQSYKDYFLAGKATQTSNVLIKKRREWLQENLSLVKKRITLNTQGLAEYLCALEAFPG